MKKENLNLTQAWDKTFLKSEKVEHKKVTFVNHFGITLAADMYVPKNAEDPSAHARSSHRVFTRRRWRSAGS